MFPEGANNGLRSTTTTTPINVGWDPVVVEVLTNWDGGKTMVGFGKLTGTIYGAWVVKMWGSTGAGTSCGADSKISGYVQMVMGLNTDLALASNCSLTSLAKVQWAWTNLVATGLVITGTQNTISMIFTSASEEYIWGAAATLGSVGADPYIIVAGGSTSDVWEAYGLNSWVFQG